MTINDLYKVLKDMVDAGLGDLDIVNANDGVNGDTVADVGETADGNFGIWWD